MEKAVNYTPSQEVELVQRYESGEPTAAIAESMGKTEKSVIAKLARLGAYRSTKPKGQARATKAEMVTELEDLWGLECGDLNSFEKADRIALEKVLMLTRLKKPV